MRIVNTYLIYRIRLHQIKPHFKFTVIDENKTTKDNTLSRRIKRKTHKNQHENKRKTNKELNRLLSNNKKVIRFMYKMVGPPLFYSAYLCIKLIYWTLIPYTHLNTSFRALSIPCNAFIACYNYMLSSLHWSFDHFLCRFSSTGAYSEWTSPLLLHHRFVLYFAKRFHFFGSRFYNGLRGSANISSASLLGRWVNP